MPWEVTFRPRDGGPIGARVEVERLLRLALRGVNFSLHPSGRDRLEAMTAAGMKVPPFLRAVLHDMPSKWLAFYQGEGFSLEILMGSDEPVSQVVVYVRGHANPLAALYAISATGGWGLFDDTAGGEIVIDRPRPVPEGLQNYRRLMGTLPGRSTVNVG